MKNINQSVCFIVVFLPLLFSSMFPQTQEKSDNPFEASAIEFVHLMAADKYSAATVKFDSTVRDLLSAEKLKSIWKGLNAQFGTFKGHSNIKEDIHQDYIIILVTCQFEKQKLDTKIVFNQDGQIAGLFFVPTQSDDDYDSAKYVKKGSFRSEEVVFGSDPWKLPGTLLLPRRSEQPPVVLLVHGSGAHDRDETIGPNKPFRDIAEGLVSSGIAVLRYEKRTKEHADLIETMINSMTVNEETVFDALQAVEFLHKKRNIDPTRIFILGHSLGGTMIPRMALQDSLCAGYIIMAGATRPLEDLIMEQYTYLFQSDSVISEEEKTQLKELELAIKQVKNPDLNENVSREKLPLGINANYWLDLKNYQPAAEAEKIDKPILILHGLRDYQVSKMNLIDWHSALAYKNEVEIVTFPKLNHLFMTGEGKSLPYEYMMKNHVAEDLIITIVNWIDGI